MKNNMDSHIGAYGIKEAKKIIITIIIIDMYLNLNLWTLSHDIQPESYCAAVSSLVTGNEVELLLYEASDI